MIPFVSFLVVTAVPFSQNDVPLKKQDLSSSPSPYTRRYVAILLSSTPVQFTANDKTNSVISDLVPLTKYPKDMSDGPSSSSSLQTPRSSDEGTSLPSPMVFLALSPHVSSSMQKLSNIKGAVSLTVPFPITRTAYSIPPSRSCMSTTCLFPNGVHFVFPADKHCSVPSMLVWYIAIYVFSRLKVVHCVVKVSFDRDFSAMV